MHDPSVPRNIFRSPPAISTQLTSLFAHTEWLRHLSEEFLRHGVVNVRDVDMPPLPWLSRLDTDNAIWALTDIHDGLKLTVGKEVADLFGSAVQETLQDIRQGRVYFTTYHTTIGQKAG